MTNRISTDIAFESMAISLGIRKERAKLAKAEKAGRLSQVGAGADLIAAMLTDFTKGIQEACDRRRSGAQSIGMGVLKKHKISYGQAAYLASTTVHDCILLGLPLTTIAFKIGERLETEASMADFKKADNKGYRYAEAKVKEVQNYDFKRQAMIGCRNKNQSGNVKPWKAWTQKELGHVGVKLIEIMQSSTGSIYEQKDHTGTEFLHATPEYKELMKEQRERNELLRPMFGPLSEKPEPWREAMGGGFSWWDLSLVKRDKGQGDKNEAPSETVITAVNAIQDTPWRVNQSVAVTVEALWKNKTLPLPKIPNREPEPKPARPIEIGLTRKDIAVKDMTPVQKELLSTYTDLLHEWNRKKKSYESKMLASEQIKYSAEQHFDENVKLHYVHQLDWRGRAYPTVASGLSPQGPDFSRGLMEFSEGKAFGTDEAAKWFMIALATHHGQDDIDFEARISWLDEHEDEVIAIGNDPISNFALWADVAIDEPYQYLAKCIEYAAWAEDGYSLDFISHQVIPQDGTCNGLQHFSALLRDPIAAAAVNLLPNDVPNDIYKDVAEEVIKRLRVEGKGDDEEARMAREWVNSGLLDRKMVKRNVMCVPYASTDYGTHQMLMERLEEIEMDGTVLPFSNLFQSVLFLNPRVHAVIQDTVASAHDVLEWLQQCTRVKASNNMGVTWETPSGFRVSQAYKVVAKGRINTHIGGKSKVPPRVSYNIDTERVSLANQKSAIAACFVHSMDAAHLMLTISAMKKDMASRGQTPSFAVLHDSFGCHAADADLMARTLRQEFVRMYEENNPLEQFKQANQKGMASTYQVSYLKMTPEEDVTPALTARLRKELRNVKLKNVYKINAGEFMIDRGKGNELEEFLRAFQPILDKADVELEITSLPAGILPDSPSFGTLDLKEVLKSTFFFA
jgi:DNA-directed RNA polymerase